MTLLRRIFWPVDRLSARYLLVLRATIFGFIAGGSVLGCGPSQNASRLYTPMEGTFEAPLFQRSRRDVFPDDLRQKPKEYAGQPLALTGIVQGSRIEGSTIVTDYEHHYWDWVEDYGGQAERVFLSSRGEGRFRCHQDLKAFLQGSNVPLPKKGFLAIVYGELKSTAKDQTVVLSCAPIIKTLPPGLFAINIWDYGRSYLLSGDKGDFRDLRIPTGAGQVGSDAR